MTPASPHLDQERLSASLDGELADAAEAAHVAECAGCRARLAQWQSAQQLVAAPIVPPSDQVDVAVSAAMAVATADPADPAGSQPQLGPGSRPSAEAPIRPLRSRRRPAPGTWARVIGGVAAAVLLVGLVAAVVTHHGGSSKGSSAASGSIRAPASSVAGSAAASGSAASGTSAAASASGARGLGPVVPKALPSIGSYNSPASLVAALRVQLHPPAGQAPVAQNSPSAASASSSLLQRCQVPARAAAEGAAGVAPVWEAALTYQGSPAFVYVFSSGSGDRAAVVKANGCQILTVVTP